MTLLISCYVLTKTGGLELPHNRKKKKTLLQIYNCCKTFQNKLEISSVKTKYTVIHDKPVIFSRQDHVGWVEFY